MNDSAHNQTVAPFVSGHGCEPPGHYSLVLSERIEHLETLALMLHKVLPDARIAILTGNLPKREREAVVAQAHREA